MHPPRSSVLFHIYIDGRRVLTVERKGIIGEKRKTEIIQKNEIRESKERKSESEIERVKRTTQHTNKNINGVSYGGESKKKRNQNLIPLVHLMKLGLGEGLLQFSSRQAFLADSAPHRPLSYREHPACVVRSVERWLAKVERFHRRRRCVAWRRLRCGEEGEERLGEAEPELAGQFQERSRTILAEEPAK